MAEPGPRQVFLSNIVRVTFPKIGTWCSLAVALNNLGEGGDASCSISGLKIGVDPFSISLGTNGQFNTAFWDVRNNGTTVSETFFKQTITLSDASKIRAFGMGNFDAGDSHNFSAFFFKAPGLSCDATVFASSGVATPPGAVIYDNAVFDRIDPFGTTTISSASGPGFADASFHFDFTVDAEEVVLV